MKSNRNRRDVMMSEELLFGDEKKEAEFLPGKRNEETFKKTHAALRVHVGVHVCR